MRAPHCQRGRRRPPRSVPEPDVMAVTIGVLPVDGAWGMVALVDGASFILLDGLTEGEAVRRADVLMTALYDQFRGEAL